MADVAMLVRAADFAAVKHENQRRKNAAATPYINHPIGVANMISEIGGVTEIPVLIAALLHEYVACDASLKYCYSGTTAMSTLEDTDATEQEIAALFGQQVLDIVKEVTDDKSMGKEERKKFQVHHAPQISREAKLVKLADKLYNLSGLLTDKPKTWSAVRTQGYFVWAQRVVAGTLLLYIRKDMLPRLRGTNEALEEKLDEVFASKFEADGQHYPAIPEGDLDQFLEEYYESMRVAND